MSVVLVTGGSGFIASHCVLQLLAAGHQVRSTLRNPGREAGLRAMLGQGAAEAGERLAFFAVDLESDAGWAEAVAGCEHVLHIASPFPPIMPKNADELIVPAREGARRARCQREARHTHVFICSDRLRQARTGRAIR